MIKFTVVKKSKKSNARVGKLVTPHGVVETPALVIVGTQATVKAVPHDMVMNAGTQLMISNTYHLHIRPGEDVVAEHGGLNKFMNLKVPLMTDSGGYQVFSLGFGRDFGVGKMVHKENIDAITTGAKPANIKITEDGVHFRSYLDGRKLFIGPKESIEIQEKLGADIILAFDECPPPMADRAYVEQSTERTHRWAQRSLDAHTSKQAIYGIVQGGGFADLRKKSAHVIGKMPFNGFAIGGEFGYEKSAMSKMLKTVIKELPDEKPRHLLGVGHPEDILRIIKQGVDTFDCTVPTQYGRHGVAFTSKGRLTMRQAKFLNDKKPLDEKCKCEVCKRFSRAYICHLLKAGEITGLTYISVHNIAYFHAMIAKIRADIKKGKI